MKGAIGSVEIFAHRGEDPVRRLTFVVGEPKLASTEARWTCRVALANLHRPVEITGRDSVGVLGEALARGREWLFALEADGFELFRDREGRDPYKID